MSILLVGHLRPTTFILSLAAVACSSLPAATWTLEDHLLRVDFDDTNASLTVTTKPTGQRWSQDLDELSFKVDHVEQTDAGLRAELSGPLPLQMSLSISPESDLVINLQSSDETPLPRAIRFPAPFITPGEDWHLVIPEAEGMLLPMGEVDEVLHLNREIRIYDMSGLTMPWIGVTDPSRESGYMMIVDTPFDASVWLGTADGRPAPSASWAGEMGRFGYERTLRYHFFASGGYVAQAKHYREYVQRTHEFVTLRERAIDRPAINRMIGAVHIYTWSDGRTLELAQDLKEAGIDRAWIGWDPDHPPYPDRGYSEGIKALGFVPGVYDLYRDIYDDEEYTQRRKEHPLLNDLWLHRYDYHGIFDEVVAREPDGSPMAMVRSSDVNLMRYWVCTRAMLPHVEERISKELAVYPHEAVFLDVTLAAGPIECFSPDHPMTHRQDAAARLDIHRYMADTLGLVVGSESGADYGVAHTEFMHGLMSLHKQFGDVRGPRGRRDDNSPTYRGDWSDSESPSMMLREHQATDRYWKYGLGEAYRVPLYELVYHDCAITSWRWNDNNHKQPETWARKDLFNALYATAPQWNLDHATWQQHRDQFSASYQALTGVLRDVGYSEMVDHRFLDTTGLLQETRFANGTRILANFGEESATFADVTIPAGGFVRLSR
jgi:hypothetical protein